ncbi:MAG: NAD-dependent epimerase/dehydratase family protein [Zoogloea sp.]|nr:NAD-dependent epimerase/dehydratase family protein [Zoogloea sp.]
MSSHRILVSGGRGFIGRRLVMALRADGIVPRVLTRDQPEADEVQGDLTDLTDRAALDLACSGIETVFTARAMRMPSVPSGRRRRRCTGVSILKAARHWPRPQDGPAWPPSCFCPASRRWGSRARPAWTRTGRCRPIQPTAAPSGRPRRWCWLRVSATACGSRCCVRPWCLAPVAAAISSAWPHWCGVASFHPCRKRATGAPSCM